MKDIKDYLHLYLGCQCTVSESEYYESGTGKLVRVDIEDDELATVSGNTSHDRTQYCVEAEFKDIKLILRPLSSMTEDEFGEFKIICEADFSKMVVIESMSKDGDYTRLCHQANAQRFMLSKHFDLFGLIDAGLAISK